MHVRFPLLSKNKASSPRVPLAIAHDYLTQRGGAERVVLALHRAFPEAPIYTTLYNPETTYPEFKDATIIVSPLNKFSIFRKNHRLALPLLPIFSQLMRVKADKTIVSSTGWAHGFMFDAKSLIYCHSPARWLYLSNQYLGKESSKVVRISLKILRPWLAAWDHRAVRRAGKYLANSTEIKERIHRVYKKNVPVVFPPYSIGIGKESQEIDGLDDFLADSDYFLVVSRLLPYKNVEVAVKAFAQTGKKLLVVGSGPDKDRLEAFAGPNTRFASDISDANMRYAYAHSLGLIAISYEDFGLTPLEAGAFGKPTIALRAGGYLDTIREGVNGVFIDEARPEQLIQAVEVVESQTWHAELIKEHVESFSEDRFITEIKQHLEKI
ncbi:glycosyltransferase [Rothia sp. ZJ1223]|uniref:glycosyltransferase n=1 Tax=Rothia sp. ZJ1223 TaxID=2811098 RepID=UPI00195BDF26|nr:glycosyltransferase [Rothia sp. ZJ1223]MBM7051401.1 glycosyltransferase [Rothia sp. ZJ1223]